jgi:hypothetical protein
MSDPLPTATRVSDPGIRALYRLGKPLAVLARQAHRVFVRLIGEALAAMADFAERGAEMPYPPNLGLAKRMSNPKLH